MTLLEKIQCQMAALEIRVTLSRLSGIATTCSAAPFQIDAIKQEIEACLRQCDVMDLEIKKLQQRMEIAGN
jgi:DNA repair ATPase RecN